MEQCPQIMSVSAYHDGELGEARRVEMEGHLSTCAACARELGELRSLSGLIAAERAIPISAGFSDRLHGCVDEWTDSSVLRFAQLVSGIAAVMLIGAGGWLLAAPDMPDEPAPMWQNAAAMLRPEVPAESGSIRTAEWIVTELGMQRKSR